ncbi:MAG TPA: DNA-3-methyladenine glycosylase I [Dehalococcoidia bacterium]|nr:DNA-3-methyladenine glycosylase I [Dehalococcoidia bacterium]
MSDDRQADVMRCGWATSDPLYVAYHDDEWGVPLHDDRALFELLTLEGAQAGLSWITILRKREGYRRAFDNFVPEIVARYDDRKVALLLEDAGIVRNRAKIAAAINNAARVLDVQREFGSLDAYLWAFAGGEPRVNAPRTLADIPASTAESDAMSRDLKKHGFKFVGSTICYAFMQAAGLVDDHVTSCFRFGGASADSGG